MLRENDIVTLEGIVKIGQVSDNDIVMVAPYGSSTAVWVDPAGVKLKTPHFRVGELVLWQQPNNRELMKVVGLWDARLWLVPANPRSLPQGPFNADAADCTLAPPITEPANLDGDGAFAPPPAPEPERLVPRQVPILDEPLPPPPAPDETGDGSF